MAGRSCVVLRQNACFDGFRAGQVLTASRQLLLLEQLACVPVSNATVSLCQQTIKVDVRGNLVGGVPAWAYDVFKANREAIGVGHRFV